MMPMMPPPLFIAADADAALRQRKHAARSAACAAQAPRSRA
jgi:hypothetical protein